MKMLAFASRNTKELLRDFVTLFFGIAFPLILLLLLSMIGRSIPKGYGPAMFNIDQLAPGISVFGLSFLSLFSGFLIAKDRSSSFMLRLFTSPLSPADFILGYTLPLLPMGLAQTGICYICSLFLGMKPDISLLVAVFVNLPIIIVFISLGLLFGSILSERAVGTVCGTLITNLSAWLSNIWFDTAMVGGAFKAIADCLPFAHAVNAARAAAAGNYAAIFPDLWWVIGYAVVLLTAAVLVFSKNVPEGQA